MRPQVDVGVVTWNTADLTVAALRHLLDADQGCDFRVLVHDNASSDGTPEALQEHVPEARLEISNYNMGFAQGMNRLIQRSDSPWFFALNSDAWPEPGAMGTLVKAAEEHPGSAAVAPLLLHPDSTLEHSTHPFPSISVALLDLVDGRKWMPRSVLDKRFLEGAWGHDRARAVDWAVGAALLMRRAALDHLGGFDERYFMYMEDLEWCWRANRAGWEIRFEPAAIVRHVGNASGALRFREGRAALEAAHLRMFLREAHRPSWVTAYRVLTALSAASHMTTSHLIRNRERFLHWRGQLLANLGWADIPSTDLAPHRNANDAAKPTSSSSDRLTHQDAGSPQPRVSVAVSSYGRAHLLPRLIGALERQTLPAQQFEVIVVDNASPDDTSAVLTKLASEAAVNLQPLRAVEQKGPAAGRNLAWRAARAPIVAFTDDDCVPAPTWLESGLAALNGDTRVVVGRTAPPADQLDRATGAFARVLSVDGVRFFETCNIFYRRADLFASGGFDEEFRQPAGEDTDLALRILDNRAQAVFAPDALVHHDVRPGKLASSLREATRWTDIPLVLRRHPAARGRLLHRWIFWKPSHPPAILAAVGLMAGLRWPPALVLVLPWLRHRLSVAPAAPGPRRRVAALPGALAIDLVEVGVMLRGSIRHHTIVL